MLRIHFSSEDLARTTLATEPDPLWEMLLSRFRLHEPIKSLAFRPWHHRLTTENTHNRARISAGARLLGTLAPFSPYFPDFLTPPQAGNGIEPGLEALASTPRAELCGQLEKLAGHRRLPGWTRRLAEGEVTAIKLVTGTLRQYHQTAIAPHTEIIRAGIAADVAHRTRCLHSGGLDRLLESFRPMMRWNPPVLESDFDVDEDLHLNGRGIRLIPSFFCDRTPVKLADPDLTPVLVYPIAQECRWTHATRMPSALDALMGRTRATVLRAVHSGATTSQLAHRLNTSLASVSRHASVLRNAGLITSHRDGPAVLHALTPLGQALLDNH